MAGTIDLGEVKLDTRKAKRDLNDLKESISSVKTDLDKKTPGQSEALARARQQLNGLGEAYQGVADAAASYARIAGGVTAGVVAFGALAQRIAQGAISAEAHHRAVDGLGGAYERIRLATNGTVTAQQAFAAQNQLTQSGLRVTGEQMVAVTQAAREFALRTGTDTASAISTLTSALAAGDTQALRPFGVNIQTGTIRTRAFREAIGQLSTAQGNSNRSTQTMGEELDRLGTSLGRLRDNLSQTTAEATGLKGVFHEMSDAIDALVDGGPLLQNFFTGILESIIPLREATGGRLQATTANQRALDADNANRANLFSTIEATRARFPGLTVGFNPSSLRGESITRMTAALSGARTLEEAQAAIRGGRMNSSAERTRQQAAIAAEEAAAEATHARLEDDTENSVNASRLDDFQLAEDQRQAREQVNAKIRELASQGIRVSPALRSRLMGLISGFRNPLTRAQFAAQMSRLEGQSTGYNSGALGGLTRTQMRFGGNLTNAQYTELMASDRERGEANIEQLRGAEERRRAMRFGAGYNGLLGETEGPIDFAAIPSDKGAGRYNLQTGSGFESLGSRYGTGLSADTYAQLRESEQAKAGSRAEMGANVAALGRRNDLSQQLGSFFSDTETLAEKGAKGVEGAFNSMSGAVSGFIDTLIEGQVPAGEAAVGLAKAALKGLAMQAVPEALFETAKGFAALAIGDPRAALHFTSAGIFAGIAVAAGAGAAGIGAAQRGASHSASASAAGPLGSSLPQSSGGSRDARPIVINVNGTVMDKEGFANAVLDGVNDAVGRGGRLSV